MNKALRIWLKSYWGWPFAVLALPCVLLTAKWLFAFYVPFLQIPAEMTVSGRPNNIVATLAVVATWITIGGTVSAVLYQYFRNLPEDPPKKNETPPHDHVDWR